jgi:hypothetical protein
MKSVPMTIIGICSRHEYSCCFFPKGVAVYRTWTHTLRTGGPCTVAMQGEHAHYCSPEIGAPDTCFPHLHLYRSGFLGVSSASFVFTTFFRFTGKHFPRFHCRTMKPQMSFDYNPKELETRGSQDYRSLAVSSSGQKHDSN